MLSFPKKRQKSGMSDNAREFLYAFKFVNNHYEQCATINCSTTDIFRDAQSKKSPISLSQGLLCKWIRKSDLPEENLNGFQFVRQNGGRLLIIRYELQ